jgi:3-methyladenine DNA glycosylase Tag
MPAKAPLSETISNAMRMGPVIVYAWMQAVGIVTSRNKLLSTECHTKAEMTHVLPNN